MNYYQPPSDHPNALEMERLQEQMDALVKQRQHLETLDFTEAVEIQHAAIEEQISFLRGSPRRSNMDDTQDLHHQAQLDEQEQAVTRVDLDLIAYKALGCAQAIRDYPHAFDSAIKRLIELANQYDNLRSKL
jgi:hypothetical protein